MPSVTYPNDLTPLTVKALHEDLKKWQRSNMWLTGAILVLTFIMMLTVAFQVYVQFAPDSGQAGMTEEIKTINS